MINWDSVLKRFWLIVICLSCIALYIEIELPIIKAIMLAIIVVLGCIFMSIDNTIGGKK